MDEEKLRDVFNKYGKLLCTAEGIICSKMYQAQGGIFA